MEGEPPTVMASQHLYYKMQIMERQYVVYMIEGQRRLSYERNFYARERAQV